MIAGAGPARVVAPTDVGATDHIYGDPETMRYFNDGRIFTPADLAASFPRTLKSRIVLVLAAALLLTGCHADITYRLDVHPNNTVTIAIREKLDDQFFNLVASQSKNGDPFGFAAAKQAGWDVSRSVTDDGDHLNVLSRTVSAQSLGDSLLHVPASSMMSAPVALDPNTMTHAAGLWTDRSVLRTKIPAPFSKSDAGANPYSGAAAAMISSVIGMHLDLKTPGKVIETNGETTPDGAVRWNLNLRGPTDIQYTVETIDLVHVGSGAAVLVGLLAFVIFLASRRKVKRPTLRRTTL